MSSPFPGIFLGAVGKADVGSGVSRILSQPLPLPLLSLSGNQPYLYWPLTKCGIGSKDPAMQNVLKITNLIYLPLYVSSIDIFFHI